MKQLPKYFVIKRQVNNPLWDKYIHWLNETYNFAFTGDSSNFCYYGYDGAELDTDNYRSSIDKFKNNPTLITLEEWDECVNRFILPEKWKVKVTKENSKILTEWKIKVSNNYYFYDAKEYDYISCKGEGLGNSATNYIEITFKQFCKYVLKEEKHMEMYSIEDLETRKDLVVYLDSKEEYEKLKKYTNNLTTEWWGKHCYSLEDKTYSSNSNNFTSGSYVNAKIITINQIKELMKEKEIIGYKLNGTASRKEVDNLLGYAMPLHGDKALCYMSDDEKSLYFIKGHLGGSLIQKAKDLKILDLWFEPVYKTKEKVISMGSFNLTVKPEGIFYSSENITGFVREMVANLGNFNKQYGDLSKKYDCNIEEITFSKTGCQNSKTTFSQWKNVWQEYLKIKQ